jgi:hypothetical protein
MRVKPFVAAAIRTGSGGSSSVAQRRDPGEDDLQFRKLLSRQFDEEFKKTRSGRRTTRAAMPVFAALPLVQSNLSDGVVTLSRIWTVAGCWKWRAHPSGVE